MNNSPITFQEDAHSLIKFKINKINNKLEELDLNIFENLSIIEAEDLIELIKQLEKECSNVVDTLNNIQNLKINTMKNKLIEQELNLKITPIMILYRTLLVEKYKDYNFSSINDIE